MPKNIDAKLLEILACPACMGNVKEEGGFIVCTQCQRKYPIKDGVPVLLVDQAQK